VGFTQSVQSAQQNNSLKAQTTHNSYNKGIKMKKRAVSLIALICALGASSVQAETVAQAIEKCRNTDNSLKRLVCYDNVAKSLRQYEGVDSELSQLPALTVKRPASVPSTPVQPAQPEARNAVPENEFGLEHKRDLSKEASELQVTIAELSKTVRGKHKLTFSDGSVWQQTDETYLKFEKGQVVTVERGLLGSFYLSVEGLNKRMKVKRLR
jgi:hypothetical protein